MTLSVSNRSASAAAPMQRIHGGPDASGVPRFDFSTNSNACGPCPLALAAVQQAEPSHYPDASYAQLRAQLAAFHGVEVGRVLLAGSASEFIFRITARVAREGGRQVCLPLHAYGDYAQAALAWGLSPIAEPDEAQLVWACEPSSPLGAAHTAWPKWLGEQGAKHDGFPASVQVEPLVRNPIDGIEGPAGKFFSPMVLDCAYAPLRLSGTPTLTEEQLAQVWQLWTPNKALGLTGVRAAYVIAPLGAQSMVAALECLCPSWPVGAHGVAMLQSWMQPEVQAWLAQSLLTLREWKARQITLLQDLGWTCLPSDTNFFCARPGQVFDLNCLRAAGIKLRDITSFGLSGHVRVSVQAPGAQDALALALQGR